MTGGEFSRPLLITKKTFVTMSDLMFIRRVQILERLSYVEVDMVTSNYAGDHTLKRPKSA